MENKKKDWVQLVTLIIILSSLLIVFFKLTMTLSVDPELKAERQLMEISLRLDSLRSTLGALPEAKIDTSNKVIQKIPEEKLKYILDSLRRDLKELRSLIMDNPEKALAIPLLKKDISNLQLQLSTELISVRRDMEKIYDSFKWMGGLLFALLISLIGIAFNNIFFKKKSPREER